VGADHDVFREAARLKLLADARSSVCLYQKINIMVHAYQSEILDDLFANTTKEFLQDLDYLLNQIEKEARNMLQIETRHREIIRSILSKYPYQFYTYGPRVKNWAKKYSDLDICFYGEIPWNSLSHIQEDLEESDIPFKVEVTAWEWMSPEFQKLIKSDLIPIK
jgi:hypothetical protein